MAKKQVEQKESPVYTEKGRLAKLGIKDPEALATRIQRDFSNAEQTKWLWIPQRAEDLKNYYGQTQAAEWPFKGASRFKSNFQRIVVDTLSGNLLKSVFAPEHPIAVNPAPLNQQSNNETLDNLKYVEDLHNSLQAYDYNLHQVLDKAIPTSLIESFCVLHPVWEYMTNEVVLTVKRWVPKDINIDDLTYDLDTDSVTTKTEGKYIHSINLETSDMTPKELTESGLQEVQFDITREECVKDGISIKLINGYRFYMPIGCPGENPYEKVQRAPYVIQQLFYTLREVNDLQNKGYFEDVDPILATVYDRQRELLTYIKLQQAGFVMDTARLEYEYVEVLKWSGRWKIDGKEREVMVWMDRNSTQILRVEVNVYGMRPYFPLVPFPVDETPYGESLCGIIRNHVKDLDLLIRTVINIALMKSAPPKFFDPASGFNPSTIGNFGPNSWIPAREPARNILQPPSPEDPQTCFAAIQLIINIIERITGVNEVIQGQVADRANTTATEIQNATARSGVRFDQIYDRYKDQLKPMFNFIHKLVLRNMPEEKEVMLMGAENKGRLALIHKANLKGTWEFALCGNSVVQEQGLLQKALMLFQTVGQHPYLSYKPESIYYMLYNIVRGLNPIAKDKILPKPEEIEQIEQQAQQAQRQQEQLAVKMAQGNQEQAKQQMEMAAQMHQMDLQAKAADIHMKAEANNQKLIQSEKEHRLKMEHEIESKRLDLESQRQKMILDLEMMRAKANEQKKTEKDKPNT